MGLRIKIYLDCCSLQRPFDDRSQLRIRLEAEAILAMFSLFESNVVELVKSFAIAYEIDNIPDDERRFFCYEFLNKIHITVNLNSEIEILARNFVSKGIKPLDALHLSCAYFSEADYFCTCDDPFYKKAKSETLGKLKIVKPLELIEEIEHDY